MKLTHSLAKFLYVAGILLCAVVVHAQTPTPSGTPVPAGVRTPPDEINIVTLLPKIAAAQRAAADAELKALNAAFANNSISISTFIDNQKDWSATAVRSTAVQSAFNKNYNERTKLVERKINVYSKYGVLKELNMPGANVTEVLAKYRAEVAEIIARGKVFEVRHVVRVAAISSAVPRTNVLANIFGVAEAVAQSASDVPTTLSEVVVVHVGPQMGCDNKVYWIGAKYQGTNWTHDVNGQAFKFIDMNATEGYKLHNRCRVENGVPIEEVWLEALDQDLQRGTMCPNSRTHVWIYDRFVSSDKEGELKVMFKGAASDCGCSTEKPKLNPDGTVPESYPGWCAYSRYQVPKWSKVGLGSNAPWEPLI